MDSEYTINGFVRRRIRDIRQRRNTDLQTIASRTGIPVSSYACMELGHYRMSLDHLYRILEALEVDIQEVWPPSHPRRRG